MLSVVLAALLFASAALAREVRYFAVWSYAENAPQEEIEAAALEARTLGYWELEFDAKGRVLSGTYHHGTGKIWFSLRYVEVDSRVYADLYMADGALLTRKSTNLASREPHWPDEARE